MFVIIKFICLSIFFVGRPVVCWNYTQFVYYEIEVKIETSTIKILSTMVHVIHKHSSDLTNDADTPAYLTSSSPSKSSSNNNICSFLSSTPIAECTQHIGILWAELIFLLNCCLPLSNSFWTLWGRTREEESSNSIVSVSRAVLQTRKARNTSRKLASWREGLISDKPFVFVLSLRDDFFYHNQSPPSSSRLVHTSSPT